MAGINVDFTVQKSAGVVTVPNGTLNLLAVQPRDANTQIRLRGFQVSFECINPTAKAIQIQLVRISTSVTGGTSVTGVLTNPMNAGVSPQSVGLRSITTVTTVSILKSVQFNPYLGVYELYLPYDNDYRLAGTDRLSLLVTQASGETAFPITADMYIEE